MKAAIVTGATSGLGLELRKRLSATQFRVIGVSRGNHATEATDILGSADIDSTVEAAFEALPPDADFSLLVNSAGFGKFGTPGSYANSDIDGVIGSNLIAAIKFSEAAIARWKSSGSRGTIVNILSTAAFTPRGTEAVYCAAKAGLKMYVDAARLELKGSGIRVLNVYPGGMKTAFWDEAGADTKTFMDAGEVADRILQACEDGQSLDVTDITINRRA
ncbi:SDR family NAD(P)-dependent oxidoreductase [Rathayibacter sp. Leaf248]|uniref:SDR family NAD(P)-dependent oxidoreductase n=1 Tax=Rathayibacter sp. Leaf248 TaxID=2876555 RepID=UPI001E3846A2|nr:SDR family NAD(P)-dependent oxidoreductase [Rathayibacter sp. Leaf248]